MPVGDRRAGGLRAGGWKLLSPAREALCLAGPAGHPAAGGLGALPVLSPLSGWGYKRCSARVARCGALCAPVGLCCAQQEQESSSSPGCPARGARGAPSLLLRGSAASLPARAGGLRCCCSAFRSPARRAALSCPSPRHCPLPSNQFLLLFSQGSSSVTRLSRRGFSLLFVLPSLRVLRPRAHPLCHDVFGARCA